jgi:hypothetical protein
MLLVDIRASRMHEAGLVSEAQMAAVRGTSFGNVFVMRPVATVHRVIRRRLEFVKQFKIRREQS